MIRQFCLLLFILELCVGALAGFDKISECERRCANGMSEECCECIGCHQAMRFGKRAYPSEKLVGLWNWPAEGLTRLAQSGKIKNMFPEYPIVVAAGERK
ncbi:hypothetical protein L596_003301 [Steinernema carpocapsae]|uniref:Uncharacterized protein n=1 Tax=Steinernema carpocapsae TaxID=34508 RepID=A0A4U8USU6_STECR|nr:hypothetical protein L596_003301 [Steinernema carpocapsae]